MDTTETYIKMCDCEEVQGKWEPKEGDYMMVDKPMVLGTQVFGLPTKAGEWPKSIMRIAVPKEQIFIVTDVNETPSQVAYRALEFELKKFRGIWLPRQDQIQEMLDIKDMLDFELAVYDMFFESDGYHHCNSEPVWRAEEIKTVEQLWLAFYMWEKHGKVWSGSEWAKAEKEIK